MSKEACQVLWDWMMKDDEMISHMPDQIVEALYAAGISLVHGIEPGEYDAIPQGSTLNKRTRVQYAYVTLTKRDS